MYKNQKWPSAVPNKRSPSSPAYDTARDLQKAAVGLRSIAEFVVDTAYDFAELVLAMLGVAAKLERRRIKERTERGRTAKGQGREIWAQAEAYPAPAARGDPAARQGRRNAALDCPQLRRQRGHDFEVVAVTIMIANLPPSRSSGVTALAGRLCLRE